MCTTGSRDSCKQTATQPFYMAGCYAVPIRCLYGTAAEINFWDVIYYCAHEMGGFLDTSTEELAAQMGLSRQVVGQLRRAAIEHGELVEDDSWISGRRFVLRVSDHDRPTRVVWKPLGYVRNSWHHVVTPAIPKRVLNLYLQQPRQSIYKLDVAYVAAKCKRQFLYGDLRPQEPLNSADVSRALRLLVRLGLLLPSEEGYRIDWFAFQKSAPTIAPSFDTPDPREHLLLRQAADRDPVLADRASELLEIGHYNLETHLAEILRDLTYVHNDDYPLLKAKVRRYRNRPPGPNQWRDTWKAFRYELKRRRAEVRSPKHVLNLGQVTNAACVLGLDVTEKRVQAMRVVCRAEWPWHLEGNYTVEMELWSGNTLLLARNVGTSDAEIRHSLFPDKGAGLTTPLVLRAHCARPIAGLLVEAWLEAKLRV